MHAWRLNHQGGTAKSDFFRLFHLDALHRLLNPWFQIVDVHEEVSFEVARSSLVMILVLPLVLGYIPLLVLLDCVADQLPTDVISMTMIVVASTIPIRAVSYRHRFQSLVSATMHNLRQTCLFFRVGNGTDEIA